MTTRAEVIEALGGTTDSTQRRIAFAGLLAREAVLPPDGFVVVGGSAIEFYTSGAYTSGDIDIVSEKPQALARVLQGWGFSKTRRVWVDEELGLVVDFVAYPYTGDFKRTQILQTPYGPVRLAAIEDLLVKRLASTKHWRIPGDFEHAKALAVLYRDRIDWGYTREMAETYSVSDLLAALEEALGRTKPS